jgi:hypothetical protein
MRNLVKSKKRVGLVQSRSYIPFLEKPSQPVLPLSCICPLIFWNVEHQVMYPLLIKPEAECMSYDPAL